MGEVTYSKVNSQLLDICERLNSTKQDIITMRKIEGDSIELLLKVVENNVELIRELVDYRMGKFD